MPTWFTSALIWLLAAVAGGLVSSWFWYLQQQRQLAWASYPVIEFEVTLDHTLRIRNTGKAAISSIEIFVTTYTVDAESREGGHVYIGNTLTGSFLKWPGPVVTYQSLKPGDVFAWKMVQSGDDPGGFHFLDVRQQTLKAFQTHYALRVLFRTLAQQRYVRYVIVPALMMPYPVFDVPATASIFGGVETQTFFELRDNIRAHQARLFDDLSSELYR